MMSNHGSFATRTPDKAKRSAPAAKLIQAAALAAMLIPLASVTADASSITCGFDFEGGIDISNGEPPSCGEGNTALFDFGDYAFKLTFEDINFDFEVTVTDVFTTQDELVQTGRLAAFPGHVCVPFAAGGTQCVDFQVIPPPEGAFDGNFEILILWDLDTNEAFPNGASNRIRMLNNNGSTPGDAFDQDVTIEGSYIAGNASVSDPGIGGLDNNFSGYIVTQAPIPEPAALLLLTGGLAGLLYRRRRQ